jgi:hypothetical protein
MSGWVPGAEYNKGTALQPFLDLNLFNCMGRPRVELGANRLKAECSTTELASRCAQKIRLSYHSTALWISTRI